MPELLSRDSHSRSMIDSLPISSSRTQGVPLVIELFRRVGAAQIDNERLRLKRWQRRLTPT